MSNNIFEVKNLEDLKTLMETNVTIILGLTSDKNDNNTKVMIKKFLKRKSEQFPIITFIYMYVSEDYKNNASLNILKGDNYPKIYHIRNNNQILVSVEDADYESIYESFSQVEKYYLKEMENFKNNEHTNTSIVSDYHIDPKIEQQKRLEKLVCLNNRYDNMKIDLIKEIKRRKQLETINNKS